VKRQPYYADEHVALYHGRMEDVLPTLGEFDACVTDPPYGETSLAWGRWPDGWPALVAGHTRSMWCFGSMRMFLDRRDEFAGWRLSQDVVWEKHNGSSFHADRFRRVHEHAVHWYRGDWSSIYGVAPVTMDATARAVRRKERPPHTGEIANSTYTSVDGGPRLMRSVLRVRSMHGRAIHKTEKPGGILAPLIEYAVPLGRRSVGIEADEGHCERAAERLSVPDLFAGAS
jgi:site-specific DNA-methyltransferase (adenine-specific)